MQLSTGISFVALVVSIVTLFSYSSYLSGGDRNHPKITPLLGRSYSPLVRWLLGRHPSTQVTISPRI